MSLAKKYNIPQEAVKRMINDGWLSCSTPSYEEIYSMYQKSMAVGGKSKTQIIHDICEEKHISERMFYYVINKFK